MFCPNCGTHLPEQADICPACRAQLPRPVAPQPTGARKFLPIFALCCGIVGTAVGMVAYTTYGFRVVFQDSTSTGSLLLVILASLLGLAAIICGILGLIRSIRTGGKKYVAGIVLSAVGIYFGLNALFTSFMSLFVSSLSGVFAHFH